MEQQPLLTPYKTGVLELRNRIVMAPLTRRRANNQEHAATGLMAEYYSQRASAGLIISEGICINRQAAGYVNTPGIYTDLQKESWKKVTAAVHKNGGKIFAQLWHLGRLSHPDFLKGELPLAPSSINPGVYSPTPAGIKPTVTPREMTLDEIRKLIFDFARCAVNAIDAGFDGVELHAANAYIFHQFFNKCSNQRTDQYGGSIENRIKILFDVLDACKEYIDLKLIGIRLNPTMHNNQGMVIDEETIPAFEMIAKRLNDYRIAYLHLTEPYTPVDDVPYAITNVAKHFRPIYKGTLIINKGFTQETGNKAITDKTADLVSFGSLYIANPDLVTRFTKNTPLNKPDEGTFYTSGPEGYTDYPFL